MNLKLLEKISMVTFLSFLVYNTIFAQSLLSKIRISPQASVTQNIGLATVEINYKKAVEFALEQMKVRIEKRLKVL